MPDQILFRTLDIDASRADDKTRQVDASLSSEEPVERFFGCEILSHQPSAVDMSRAADGLPLLFSHDPEQIIGLAERIRIEAGKLRASLRFATTPKADELWSLVRDGILRGVSIGYRILKMEPSGQTADGESIFTASRWQPLEASLVAVGADGTVGIGRSRSTLSLRNSTMNTPENSSVSGGSSLAREERMRCIDINAIANFYPANEEIRNAAKHAIESGMPLTTFQSQVLPLLGSRSPQIEIDDTPVNLLGLSQRETKQFSILRAVRALVSAKLEGKSAEKIAPFELECSAEIAGRLGKESRGFYLPLDVQRSGNWSQRALPLDSSQNSDLVATDHLAGSFIDALRSQSQCVAAGAQVLTGLIGNIAIPKLAGSAVFAWVAEGADSSDSEPTTDSVTLTPKTVTSSVPITRRLTLQSSPQVELLIRNDLVLGASLALDIACLRGSGASNEPRGISATSGINTSSIASAGAPTWAEICEFETTLAVDNALRGSLRYMVTPSVGKNLKITPKDAGSGQMLLQGGLLNDYVCIISNNLATDGILFGNFNDLLVGVWGVIDVLPDVATLAKSAGVVLRCFLDADCSVRYPQSFCLGVIP